METPPVAPLNEPDQQSESSRPSAPSGAPQQPTASASSVPPHDDGYEAV